MAESFSDLWASSNPVKSQQTVHKTLSAVAQNSANASRRTTPDAFSMLASAGSSQPNSRPITPSIRQSAPSKPPMTNTGDAFGGLVSFGGPLREGGLTIAERAAKAERDRIEQAERERATLKSQGSFWDQFEGDSKLPAKPTAPTHPNGGWDLDFLSSEPTSLHAKEPVKAENPDNSPAVWDLDFISPAPAIGVTPPTVQPSKVIFDIDDLGTLGTAQPPHPKESSRANTPGSFDFGEREAALLGGGDASDEEEDDILGSLAKPVESARRASPATVPDAPSPAPSRSPARTSPPPHVLGQIVEMGFSVQQAKVALAATATGLDVDAALEILLQNTNIEPEERDTEREREAAEAERKRKRRQGPSRATISLAGSSTPPRRETPSNLQQEGLQDQADKLLAQASTIGLSVFNKANAFWKEGRERVAKAYEEQRAGSTGVDPTKGKGRPRWMDQGPVNESANEGFSDQDAPQRETRPAAQKQRPAPPEPQPQDPLSLLATEEKVYKSPARRRRPPAPASTSKTSSRVATPAPVPAPRPITRPNIAVSPSALATSSKHKALGTEHFKLGRFAEADAAYSSAIEALPTSHLLRVPLHNNRALTRLKTGDYKGTVVDVGEVVLIVTGDLGAAWHPGREAEKQSGVELGEALGKALRRRAEAYEGLEKWKEAVGDWERLSVAAWVGHALRGDAVKGAARCRRLVASGSASASVPATAAAPKPKPKPIPPSASTRPSEALSRVRAANNAQEAEDQARHDLKDVVDARLATWRAGKETNLRALIASLDTVLWPALGWQNVNMSELISPGQVKLRYTKAIAKLHPDKLNVNNTTLEQRMIANGVFGTLNDAWNAFR